MVISCCSWAASWQTWPQDSCVCRQCCQSVRGRVFRCINTGLQVKHQRAGQKLQWEHLNTGSNPPSSWTEPLSNVMTAAFCRHLNLSDKDWGRGLVAGYRNSRNVCGVRQAQKKGVLLSMFPGGGLTPCGSLRVTLLHVSCCVFNGIELRFSSFNCQCICTWVNNRFPGASSGNVTGTSLHASSTAASLGKSTPWGVSSCRPCLISWPCGYFYDSS